MDRRRFLLTSLAGALVEPLGAEALAARVYRIGVIYQGGPYSDFIRGLRDGLKERGLEEEKQFRFLLRDTKGELKSVEVAARAFEAEKIDLICTVATSVTVAAVQATQRIPIVFYAGTDPVTIRLVKSFRKPGGRLTGIYGQLTELTPKRLELLKEMIPTLRRVVTFYDPNNPAAQQAVKLARAAGHQLNVDIVEHRVASVEALRASVSALPSGDGSAFFYISDAMVATQYEIIIAAATAKRLPSMFNYKDAVLKGALASYGESYHALGRVSAKLVQQVLMGADPGTLPVEQYDRPEFFINLRTAKALGLTIPPLLLARADQVIE